MNDPLNPEQDMYAPEMQKGGRRRRRSLFRRNKSVRKGMRKSSRMRKSKGRKGVRKTMRRRPRRMNGGMDEKSFVGV